MTKKWRKMWGLWVLWETHLTWSASFSPFEDARKASLLQPASEHSPAPHSATCCHWLWSGDTMSSSSKFWLKHNVPKYPFFTYLYFLFCCFCLCGFSPWTFLSYIKYSSIFSGFVLCLSLQSLFDAKCVQLPYVALKIK